MLRDPPAPPPPPPPEDVIAEWCMALRTAGVGDAETGCDRGWGYAAMLGVARLPTPLFMLPVRLVRSALAAPLNPVSWCGVMP